VTPALLVSLATTAVIRSVSCPSTVEDAPLAKTLMELVTLPPPPPHPERSTKIRVERKARRAAATGL
jgi:hypothetical protein